MSLLCSLLRKLRNTIHSDAFFQRSRVDESAFTRNRILGFSSTLTYILWCAKTSLPSTLSAYLTEQLGRKRSCTRQAFSKRRRLIKVKAFEELFRLTAEHLVKSVPQKEGFVRLLAVDGTRASLPTHPDLERAFGIQKSSGNQIQALISTLYDVENHFVLDVQVRPHNGSEREMALHHIERVRELMGDQSYLIMFDRGYPSGNLLETLLEYDILFLMRCPSEFVRALDKDKDDCWVEHQFWSIRKPVRFRLIRFTLPNGSSEILCTSLPNEFSTSELVDLYRKRWGIETNYNFLKNTIQLENLSGITYCAVMQQIYACLIMDNLCGAYYLDNASYEVDANAIPKIRLRLNRPDRLKCERRINKATALASIRSILPRALAFHASRLNELVDSISVPRRKNSLRYDKPNRSKPRLRLHPSLKFPPSQRVGY